MKTRRKNYSLTDLKKNVQVKEGNKRKAKTLEKENNSPLNKINKRKHLHHNDELVEEKISSAITRGKNKTTNDSVENSCYARKGRKGFLAVARKERRGNPKKITKPTSNNLQNKGRKVKEVKGNSLLSSKANDGAVKNSYDSSRRRSRKPTKETKLAKNKPQNKDSKLRDVIVKESSSFSNKDSETVMKSKSKRKQKQEKKTDIKNSDMENVEDNDLEKVDKIHITNLKSNVDNPQRNDKITDMETYNININKDKILTDKAAEQNSSILRRESNMEETVVKTKMNNVKTMENTNIEPMEEKLPFQGDNFPTENNLEIPESSGETDIPAIEDDNDCPEEVTFFSSREEALETLKIMKSEDIKRKQEQKEMRKRIQDRNILQKKQKKDKANAMRKRKLPPELLEYVSKLLPGISENDEIIQSKQEEAKFLDVDKDEESEKFPVEKHELKPSEEDFISIHGSTEFRACYLEKKKPKSVAAGIADFKERMFLGNKHNKRESVWEIKSKKIKQAAAGKL